MRAIRSGAVPTGIDAFVPIHARGATDEFTPYAEYCTANANTPGSACGFSAGQPVAGWFGIGGTSLSSPLWSAIIADRDGWQGYRSGNVNPLLYSLFNNNPSLY